MNNINPISIRFSPEFEKQLYKLSKRYRKIRDDIQPVIIQLQEGEITGERLIVNYPHQKLLNPKKVATRADVCALLYRAMVSAGEVADLPGK